MSQLHASRPLRSHPLFAPFCALWLAALFGAATWIVPGDFLPAALRGLSHAGAVAFAAACGGALGYLAARFTRPRRKARKSAGEAQKEKYPEEALQPAEPRRSRQLVTESSAETEPQLIVNKPIVEEIADIPCTPLAVEELVAATPEVDWNNPEPAEADQPAEPFAGLPARFRSPLDGKPLDELGTTELLERLAVLIHRRLAGA